MECNKGIECYVQWIVIHTTAALFPSSQMITEILNTTKLDDVKGTQECEFFWLRF